MKPITALAILILAICGISLLLHAQQRSVSIQGAGIDAAPANSEATSSANMPVSITISTGNRAVLWGFTARCSAGSADVMVQDGSTIIWSSDTAFIGTSTKSVGWTAGLVASRGNSLVVTLDACGGGDTGVLDVQASTF